MPPQMPSVISSSIAYSRHPARLSISVIVGNCSLGSYPIRSSTERASLSM